MTDFAMKIQSGNPPETPIQKKLRLLSDEGYKSFTAALIPGIDKDKMIGVRIPALRKLAAEILKEDATVLMGYMETFGPDSFYEEKQLWGILIGKAKITDEKRMEWYRRFVPVIDNWAVCDIACASIPAIKKNPEPWFSFVTSYLGKDSEFEIRFGVVMLLSNFINDEYIDRVLDALSGVRNPAYYVTMAVGWTLAACYVRFPQKAEALLAKGVLTPEIQNKTIQKIRESRSVSDENKEHMKGYKRK